MNRVRIRDVLAVLAVMAGTYYGVILIFRLCLNFGWHAA